jgi:hypothetical protein
MTNETAGSPAPSPEVTAEPVLETQSPEVSGDTEVTEEAPQTEAEKPNDPHKLANALNKAKAKNQEKSYLLKQERLRTQQLMQELEQIRSGQSPKTAEPQDDVEKFVDSRAEKIASAKLQEHYERIEQKRISEQRSAEFKQRVESFKDKMPDIMDVLEANRETELPNYLVETIATLPEGPAIAAYAFKEDLMDDIVDMSPAMAMMEIARIRNTINEIGTAKPVTKAPAPMKAVRGNSAGVQSLENMSSSDLYHKWLKS